MTDRTETRAVYVTREACEVLSVFLSKASGDFAELAEIARNSGMQATAELLAKYNRQSLKMATTFSHVWDRANRTLIFIEPGE